MELLLKTFTSLLLLAFFIGCQPVSLSSGATEPAALGGGKFSINAEMHCIWRARDDVEDTVKLSVKCENQEARVTGGVTDLKCEYKARPQRCPGYLSDPGGFWKHVARALRRRKDKVCRDERALVKAGMCKHAPQEAHFRVFFLSSLTTTWSTS